MSRSVRQSKLLDLIEKNEIETQEELGLFLERAGYDVTQATISRDIKELGLVKVIGENKKYKYSAPHNYETGVSIKMINMFRESLISMDSANNLIVLKTLTGSANSAGMLIDKMNIDGVLGCVAGDDTVLIIGRSSDAAHRIINELRKILD